MSIQKPLRSNVTAKRPAATSAAGRPPPSRRTKSAMSAMLAPIDSVETSRGTKKPTPITRESGADLIVERRVDVRSELERGRSIERRSREDDANVIALAMWRTSFGGVNDFGLGAAIAVFLFLLVIPVLLINIRRFRREV